jgi:hypothetical protein
MRKICAAAGACAAARATAKATMERKAICMAFLSPIRRLRRDSSGGMSRRRLSVVTVDHCRRLMSSRKSPGPLMANVSTLSVVIWISAASRSLFNAGSDWMGSCAITIKRRCDRCPSVQSQNSAPALLRAAIKRSRKSRKLLCYSPPNLALRLTARKVKVLPLFKFFGPRGSNIHVLSTCALKVLNP